MWSGKCPVGEMSQWGNVQSGKCPSGKCPVGELSVRGNVRQGSVRRGSVSRGIVLGEVSVRELSSRGTVRITSWIASLWCLYYVNFEHVKQINLALFKSSHHRRCSIKSCIRNISAIFTGKHLYLNLFLTKLQTNFIKKETPTKVFPLRKF